MEVVPCSPLLSPGCCLQAAALPPCPASTALPRRLLPAHSLATHSFPACPLYPSSLPQAPLPHAPLRPPPQPTLQATSNQEIMAQVMALPNWNASSPDWKPLLDLNQGVAVQEAALLSISAPICEAGPLGSACS